MSRGRPPPSSPRAPRSASERREAAGGAPRPAAGLRGALGSEAGGLRRERLGRQAGRQERPGAGSRSRGASLLCSRRYAPPSLNINRVPPGCAPFGSPSFTTVCSFLSSDGRKGCASHLSGAGHLCSTLDFSLSVFHALAVHSYGKREGPGPDKTRIQRSDGYFLEL